MCVAKVNGQLLKELSVKKRTEVSNTFFLVLLIITLENFFQKSTKRKCRSQTSRSDDNEVSYMYR